MDHEGASNNERLLAAAKDDNDDLLLEIFEDPDSFDINYQDGLGNTGTDDYVRVKYESASVLDHILCHEECDVDPINLLERATPLHFAIQVENPENRASFVEQLLDAGADYTIQDKNGDTALDLIRPDDKDVLSAFGRIQAEANIDEGDIAHDDDDDGDGDVDDESD